MPELELLSINAGTPRKVTRNGRVYYVAPMTLIVPGVLNGSHGALYYSAEELAKDPWKWNDVPMVVYHPVKGTGNSKHPTSGRDPYVLDYTKVGRVYNAHFQEFLKAEGWFDLECTRRVDARVYNALEAGTPIELSTGLFLDRVKAPANSVFNGVAYDEVTSNYRPDHLAILPDQKGACDVDRGCGVNVRNQQSHDQLHQQLCDLVCERFGPKAPPTLEETLGYEPYGMTPYVVSVFDKYVIFSQDGKLWKIGYTLDLRSDQVALSNEEPQAVRQVTTYKPVQNQDPGTLLSLEETDPHEEVQTIMNRTAIIDFLVANCDCWKHAGDREVLEKFTDAKLNALKASADKEINDQAVANAARKGFTDAGGTSHVFNEGTRQWEAKAPATPAPRSPAEPTANRGATPAPPKTADEWLKDAPPEVRAAVQNMMKAEQGERDRLVEQLSQRIIDNTERDQYRTKLKSYDVDVLRDMARLVPNTPNYPPYYGAGGAPPVGNRADQGDDDDLLPLPEYGYQTAEAD